MLDKPFVKQLFIKAATDFYNTLQMVINTVKFIYKHYLVGYFIYFLQLFNNGFTKHFIVC